MKPKLEGAALAPLVYWLLIVTGLAGITVLRFGSYGSFVTSDDVVALWAGSVAGVGLGQLVSAARIRLWVPIVIGMFGFWFLLPILFLVVDGIFGPTAQTFILAFLPAMACGYLSLSERGALLSFWYPAVLWMIVILDGPLPGVFDERFALPFVVGLAALFVVFLRARQTRRVAIWKAHSSDRLADAMPRTVLRASPIRAAGQHVFSAMTGAVALVLTAWIAPHLWDTTKDASRSASASASRHGAGQMGSTYSKYGGKPCCPTGLKKRERVKEYFPLQRAHDTDEDDITQGGQCRVCNYEDTSVATMNGGGKWSYGGTPGSGLVSGVGSDPWGSSNPWGYGSSYGSPYGSTYGNGTGTWSSTPTTNDPPTYVPPPPPPPVTYDPPLAQNPPAIVPPSPVTPKVDPAKPHATSIDPAPAAAPVAATTPTSTSTLTPTSTPVSVEPPSGGSLSFPAPWKSSLGLCTIAFAFILFSRALRRALTLRHLTQPFWNESFDQRISNHWERMLIGLRDAGLEPGVDEQPLAFAKRVGIEGMEACATILERVRHGVRVESDDLSNMGAATDAVFRAARDRAGLAARATAWLRPPTA
jgi:hypothetical protein